MAEVNTANGTNGTQRLSWVITPDGAMQAALRGDATRYLLLANAADVEALILDLAQARGEMAPAPIGWQVELLIRSIRRRLLDG